MVEQINLGLMSPLTGVVSIYGAEICHAAQIACDEINEQGGLLGKSLNLIIVDDGSLPDTAIPAASQLIENHKCVAIIGNLLSNSRIAVANLVAEPKRIPMLNFSFYEGSISGRYFFHLAALPNQQIDRMIPYMGERYGFKMFFAGNNYEWPRGSIDAAKISLRKAGGDIVGEEYLALGASDNEINNLLEQVACSGADVFVPYFAGLDQQKLLTRFTEMGLKDRMAVVMGHYDEVMVSGLEPEVRADFYSTNTYFMSVDTIANKNVLKRLSSLEGITGIWPKGNGLLSNFGEGAYLCVHAFAKAAQKAGSTDAEALVNALEHISVEGPQGIVKMDPATHHAHVNTYLSRCKADGTFKIIESFGQVAPVIPERYQQQRNDSDLSPPYLQHQSAKHLAIEMRDSLENVGTAQQILSLANMAIVACDEQGVIIESNTSAENMFGYTSAELIGMSVHQLLPPHIRSRHREMMDIYVNSTDEIERRMAAKREVTGYRKDGSFFPVEASIAKVRYGKGWMLVATMRDISQQKNIEEQLIRNSTHDSLTGMANRTLIRERLNNALERSLRSDLSVGILFIDLDDFKLVNDIHGHDAGDTLLQSVAKILMEQVRPGDTIARLGGDEFVVLCEQVSDTKTLSNIAEHINVALRQPINLDSCSLYITVSIGIAVGHGSIISADDLLRQANAAMYAVKNKGRDGWQFFDQHLQTETRQKLTITQGLRTAIQNNELSPRFQPIISVKNNQIIGAELLLRWHPEGGEISPSVFIPVAEATGIIGAIGTWVFRCGCNAQANWQRLWGKNAPSYISINVSTRQLSEAHLVEEFTTILNETGANPERIMLEITETSLMADIETNLRVLRQLAALGLRVAVDDFGTGYSSLAQLTRLPVTVLKIDKAFIDDVESNAESRTVIRAIMGLGRALGMKLIAEGVERQEQMKELQNNGCDYIQGYLFYRPMDEKAFIETYSSHISSPPL